MIKKMVKVIDFLVMIANKKDLPQYIVFNNQKWEKQDNSCDYYNVYNYQKFVEYINYSKLNDFVEIQEKILDAKEKEYLSNVIRPFRKQVEYIKKVNISQEFISIRFKENSKSKNFNYINLPFFKKGTMYKNMETNKAYSLEELGL